jgi:hypothetical protein
MGVPSIQYLDRDHTAFELGELVKNMLFTFSALQKLL